MSTVLPILAAVGSAAGFGLSTALEHHEVGSAPSGTVALLCHVLRRPMWLLGLTVSVVALALYAVAVDTGALGLVQPILISGIVFALPIRAIMDRDFPSGRELGWAAATCVGLAVFLAAASTSVSNQKPHTLISIVFVAVGVPVAALLARRGMGKSGNLSGVLLGGAAGVVSGLMAGVLKLTVTGMHSPLRLITHWQLWAFIMLAGWVTLLNQHAYREAPLAVSMPIVNILGPLIGISFAAVVFGEIPQHRPIDIAIEVVGLAAIGFGLHGLAGAVTSGPAVTESDAATAGMS